MVLDRMRTVPKQSQGRGLLRSLETWSGGEERFPSRGVRAIASDRTGTPRAARVPGTLKRALGQGLGTWALALSRTGMSHACYNLYISMNGGIDG